MNVLIRRLLRLLLFVLAALSGVYAILRALMAMPEPGRNPSSPEFGADRSEWFLGAAIASALIVAAILFASGRTRIALVTLLLIVWLFSMVPAYHFYMFHILPDLERRSAPAQR